MGLAQTVRRRPGRQRWAWGRCGWALRPAKGAAGPAGGEGPRKNGPVNGRARGRASCSARSRVRSWRRRQLTSPDPPDPGKAAAGRELVDRASGHRIQRGRSFTGGAAVHGGGGGGSARKRAAMDAGERGKGRKGKGVREARWGWPEGRRRRGCKAAGSGAPAPARPLVAGAQGRGDDEGKRASGQGVHGVHGVGPGRGPGRSPRGLRGPRQWMLVGATWRVRVGRGRVWAAR